MGRGGTLILIAICINMFGFLQGKNLAKKLNLEFIYLHVCIVITCNYFSLWNHNHRAL